MSDKTCTLPSVLVNLGAVGGGADGVADVDAAFSRDAGGEVRFKSGESAGETFEACASGLAVGGGFSSGGEFLNASAAAWGQLSLARDVIETTA